MLGHSCLQALIPVGLLGAQSPVLSSEDTLPPAGSTRTFAANSGPVDIEGLIGGPGAANIWDFTEGPENSTVDLIYEDVREDAAFQAAFAKPQIAERRIVDGMANQSEPTMFRLSESGGKENLGFFLPITSPSSPFVAFSKPLLEIPPTLALGDSWTSDTTFTQVLTVLGMPLSTSATVNQSGVVDASGTMKLPGLGEVEVLRVNLLVQCTRDATISGTNVRLSDLFTRSYYWYARHFGVVAAISSEPLQSVPGSFSTASSFQRLTQATGFRCDPRASGSQLTISRSDSGVRLSWNFSDVQADDVRFRVESSSALASGPWRLLAETRSTSLEVASTLANTEFFRIVATGWCEEVPSPSGLDP